MATKKIACLGGGSMYFARALPDLAAVRGLAGSEIVLYDIDVEKAQVMARHGARMAAKSDTGLTVRASDTLAEALDGADFAITSIGGSGASIGGVYGTGYHLSDILIPAKYGIYQIVGDTGGPAGMMMGLRSIPIYVNICHEMEKRCPDAVLFNHSNPMAPLCRAMNKYTSIKVVGICHGVQGGIVHLARFLGVSPYDLETTWIGTNHYHWFIGIRYQGKDIYPEVRRKMAEATGEHGHEMTRLLGLVYGYNIAYPEDDHIVEFYPFMTQLQPGEPLPYGQKAWLGAEGYNTPLVQRQPSEEERRTQRVHDLHEMETKMDGIDVPAEPSDHLTGEGLGRLIESIALGRRDVYVVNVENKGAVPNLPSYANLEIEGVTDSQGVRGIYVGEAPTSLMGLLTKRIAWQELVADAAVTGDRNLALQACLLDEMAIRPEKAEAMLDELLEASRPMLPAFFKG
jgi:alpha-galactosidase